ncbi:putative pentatricopeptide repeat-containing protein [Tanacetum coccineum]
MSDHIPFDIQSEIIKRLPVKSLIQFRSVSKQWKSFIDNPKFIKNYHINHLNPRYHLLVSYELDNVQTYTSIIDDNTFPEQKFPLTALESLSLLRDTLTLSSVDGLLCFYGFYGDVDLKTKMAVIWNPAVRKSVGIVVIPKAGYDRTIVGFGVCPDTSDPKLVKISVDATPSMWEVDVFTLSTRVWKTVYTGAPFKSCDLSWFQVFVNGVIYFHAYDSRYLDDGVRSNFVISFVLKSEKFGEVCLPERLVHTPFLDLHVAKVNESLGLLEYYPEGGMTVCGVWSRKDGANNPFTKIYTVKGKGLCDKVLGFRNNGDVVTEVVDDEYYEESGIKVYEPSSGHIIGVRINGKRGNADEVLIGLLIIEVLRLTLFGMILVAITECSMSLENYIASLLHSYNHQKSLGRFSALNEQQRQFHVAIQQSHHIIFLCKFHGSKAWTAIYIALDNVGMWNIRSLDWVRQYLAQQFYLRVYSPAHSWRDELSIPKNALLCGRARGRHTRPL